MKGAQVGGKKDGGASLRVTLGRQHAGETLNKTAANILRGVGGREPWKRAGELWGS